MHIEGVHGQRGLALTEPAKVDEGHDEARGAAIGVLEDPPKVTLDGNGRPCEAMEGGNLVGFELRVEVIGGGHPLEKTRDERDEFWEWLSHGWRRWWRNQLWASLGGVLI